MRLQRVSNRISALTALVLGAAAALGAAGCQNGTTAKSDTKTTPPMASLPATGPTMQAASPTIPTTGPVAPEAAGPKAEDMTHVLGMDEPYFLTMPGPAAIPDGTFKSGTKVLVMVPGSKYSKVLSETGVTAYTVTKGLEPVRK